MTGTYAEDVAIEPFLPSGRRHDTDNIGPRAGATYALTDRTVLRGGFGKYFADIGANRAYWTNLVANALFVNILNDGRADFVTNPFNGPVPTFDQVAQRLCSVSNTPGCLRRSLSNTLAAPENEIPFSYQGSVGRAAPVEQHDGGRSRLRLHGHAEVARRDQPQHGVQPRDRCELRVHRSRSPAISRVGHGLSAVQHRRVGLSRAATRVHQAPEQPVAGVGDVSLLTPVRPAERADSARLPIRDDAGPQGGPVCDVPVTLAPDLAEEWYLTPDQRKRATLNGIWDLPYAISVERQVPLRRQRLGHAELRRRRAADRQQRRALEGGRHADSAQQLRQAVDP